MCTSSVLRPSCHPEIQLLKNSDGELQSDFQIMSHTPSDITRAIIGYTIPVEGYTNDQRQALHDYNQLRTMPSQNMKDRNLLLKYLHIFDRIFFFGALNSNVEFRVVEIIPEIETDLVGLTEMNPEWRSTDTSQESKPVIITIGDHTKVGKPKSGEALVDEYLGTLLHEALHAMFDLYACIEHRQCHELYFSQVGCRGHSIRWVEAANLIEAATIILGMARRRANARLSLSIESSVSIDAEESE